MTIIISQAQKIEPATKTVNLDLPVGQSLFKDRARVTQGKWKM